MLPTLAHIILAVALLTTAAADFATCEELPSLEHRGDRYSLLVDGKPFLLLGAQVSNSSGWPDQLQSLWPKATQMHINTLEVPVYWQQMEPREGVFDDTVVDNIVHQAREHGVRLVLLWFGTWKNGEMHYVPDWVKLNPQRFPRMQTRSGELIDVLSANASANLEADRAAFTHLMRHLAQIDRDKHTVILIQVENESGALGSVRDFSAAAQKQFDGPVPTSLLNALHLGTGTWKGVFGADADEYFQAWSVASYVNAVASSGKRELALPMYVNNWLKSPRGFPVSTIPGVDYPSGGPTWNMIPVWKVAAPAIDILAPDIYVANTGRYKYVMEQFHRTDNPLLIPETQGFGNIFLSGSEGTARNCFLAIGAGAIGFSPFGLDSFQPEHDGKPDYEQIGLAQNFELLAPMSEALASLQLQGAVQTAVEEPGLSQIELTFGEWSVLVSFPPSYSDGADAFGSSPTAALHMGRVLVAQSGPDEFVVAGIDARVTFRHKAPGNSAPTEFLRVEEGSYSGTQWRPARILNGDETESGLTFRAPGDLLHVSLHTY